MYIRRFKSQFVQCYANQKLYFETIVMSRKEEAYAALKQNLDISTNNLKIVMNNINLLLKNQRHNYLIAFDEAKMHFLIKLQINIFRNLLTFVTPYAL